MATIAAIAASAVSIGTSAYQASQAGGGAGGSGRAPRFAQPPEPAYERALRRYTTRLLAQGAASVPPSFLDYVSSGGTAKFDLGDTRMTPGEAKSIGEFQPRVDPGQKQLTLDQLLYLSQRPPGSLGQDPRLRMAGQEYRTLQRLEGKPEQGPGRVAREQRLTQKLKKTDFGPYV